jgi:hypothetical protein
MAVDSPHQRMVAQEVTRALTADEPLRPMAMRVKETPGVDQMRAVAELGDDHGHASNAWAEAGIAAYGPTPATSAHTTRGRLGQEHCSEDPPQDGNRCPAGEARTCRCATTARGRPIRSDATAAGRRGPLQDPCTSNTAGRRRTRGVEAHILERMEERFNATPASMQERKPLGEHPCGTLNHANAQGDGLMKGLKNARAECRLACVADHRKRGINSRGVPQLLGALG